MMENKKNVWLLKCLVIYFLLHVLLFPSAFVVVGENDDENIKDQDDEDDMEEVPTDDDLQQKEIEEIPGATTIAKYPLKSGKGNLFVVELENGQRAIAFGENDFQTLTGQWNVENDADFHDIEDYYIRGYISSFGLSDSFISSLQSCQSLNNDIRNKNDNQSFSHSLLMFGLGGGSMARYFHGHYPFINVTVVEIEPGVVEAAQKYFNVKPDTNLHLVVDDVRDYLAKLDADVKYDFIFHDGCDGNGIIAALNTKEVLTNLKNRLAPKHGVMVTNAVFLDPKMESPANALREILRTYREVFPYVMTLCLHGGHTMIFSSVEMDLDMHLLPGWVERLHVIDPMVDHETFLKAGLRRKDEDGWHEGCVSYNPEADGVNQLTVRIGNLGLEPIGFYWDHDPVRYLKNCSSYPVESRKGRSLTLQRVIKPKETLRVQTYPGHVFVVMKGDTIIDCVTITMEHASRPWFFGQPKK